MVFVALFVSICLQVCIKVCGLVGVCVCVFHTCDCWAGAFQISIKFKKRQKTYVVNIKLNKDTKNI